MPPSRLVSLALLHTASLLAASAGLDPSRLAAIPTRMQAFVDAGTAPGIVTLVARHGEIAALKAVGYFDLESRKPMPVDAIFQIHSMTKPVVALAALMLAEQGRLSLLDPVEKHIPEFRGQMIARREGDVVTLRKPKRLITIRDLMTHTSGLPPNPTAGIAELHGALHKTLSDVVLIYSQTPLDFEPGEKFQYSNPGMATLARIIEVLGGMPFEKFLETRIFTPLGMNDTYFYPPKEKWRRMPTAYILKDGKPLKYTSDPLGEGLMKFREGAKYPLPEGGMYSTATDLFHLYQMLLNRGVWNGVRLFSPASVELMTRVHTGGLATSTPGAGWGLGVFVIDKPTGTLSFASPGTYGHGGRYGTYFFIDPKRDMIGIFMIHREGGSDERTAFMQMALSSVMD